MLTFAGAGVSLDAFMVSTGATLYDAVASHRRSGCGVAAVVDADAVVVGVVTDHSIRRAVLAGHTLETSVTTVMTGRPIVELATATESTLADTMRTYRMRSVPLVDADGRLADVRSADRLPDAASERIGVIMAGGRGERLRPLTDKVPKPLLRVGPSSIVERLIQRLADASIAEVFLAVNYKADEFERRLGDGTPLGVRLSYLREDEPLGTAGALSLLPSTPHGPTLVTNGDIVTTLDFNRLLEFHWHHKGAVTVAGVWHDSPIPYGVLHTAQHHLLSIEEKPHRRDLCSAGIYVLEPEALALIPDQGPKTMPELIADALAEGLPVHVFPIVEKWFDIGGSAEFERVLVDFALGEDE